MTQIILQIYATEKLCEPIKVIILVFVGLVGLVIVFIRKCRKGSKEHDEPDIQGRRLILYLVKINMIFKNYSVAILTPFYLLILFTNKETPRRSS